MTRSLLVRTLLLLVAAEAASVAARREAFRRDPGHPQWHHGAFHDVEDSVRANIRRMLHTRAEVPFQVPLEVNVVLIGFNGDGGYRYPLDGHKLEQFLKMSFPLHRPSCFETGEPVDIEHHIMYNVIAAGQPELISLEKSLKEAMVPAGTARESEYGREFPLFEVEATMVEPIFQRLYSFIFDMELGHSATEMNRPVPVAIFVVNVDKVRMDPRNKEVDLDNLMYGTIGGLTEQELKKQEADYIYRYRYNGGGSTQVWLSSGRFVVIDLSAGPCTYGKIETEEGSVGYRSLPRLSQIIFPRGLAAPSATSTQDIFIGQLGGLISTTIEHVIAPDVRYAPLDSCLLSTAVSRSDERNNWPVRWPGRLNVRYSSVPDDSATIKEKFDANTKYWKQVISEVYFNDFPFNWSRIRNVMDMNAGSGGFAAALIDQPLWVMNVVSTGQTDTLPVIFSRGLIGVYHDWCESFNTYPRTYDLLHMSHLLGSLTDRCDIIEVAAEIDRILRPGRWFVLKDTMEMIKNMCPVLKSLHYETVIVKQQFLVATKSF